jgi:Zn-dependent M28 family amino/carboxypeptidase
MFAMLCALFALSGCHRGSDVRGTPFDGEKALGYVRTFMDFGPRVPGTDAARRAGDWITEQMRQRADTVVEQRWTHVTAKGDSLPLRNVLARYRPAASARILYVTHWDSRPVSDESADPAKRKLPVPGANDGGSGVGLFLALGDALKSAPPSVGVDLLFVDGEDYGQFGPPDVDVLMGSEYFAHHLPSPDYQILFGVLWDMIGDSDLQIYQEQISAEKAPEVVTRVWEAAADLGYSNYFRPQARYSITDDHVPLLDAGLRVIDVIDFDYLPYHHTPEDTIDKLSAHSLKVVGDVAWRVLQQ